MKVRVHKRIQMAKNAVARYTAEQNCRMAISLTPLGEFVLKYMEEIQNVAEPEEFTVARKKDDVVVATCSTREEAEEMIAAAKRGKKASLYIMEMVEA